jgi:hypothetical protein
MGSLRTIRSDSALERRKDYDRNCYLFDLVYHCGFSYAELADMSELTLKRLWKKKVYDFGLDKKL